MIISALAYFFSLMLSIVLGGLLTFFVKVIIAFALLPLIAIMAKNKRQTHTMGSPLVLTIDFLSNIFYGYMANRIGIWVFNYFEVPIDWFYPTFILVAFLWFDIQRLRRERARIKEIGEKEEGMRSRLPEELLQQQMQKFQKSDLIQDFNNARITGMIGKATGVILGAFNLIIGG
jgi:Flp pilus assembly protein TadB